MPADVPDKGSGRRRGRSKDGSDCFLTDTNTDNMSRSDPNLLNACFFAQGFKQRQLKVGVGLGASES